MAMRTAYKNAFISVGIGAAFGVLVHFVDVFLPYLGVENNLFDEVLISGSFAVALFISLGSLAEKGSRIAREKLEAELRRSEERMRMAFEAARIGFWDWDIVKDEQVWSEGAKVLFGLPGDSPANMAVLTNAIHPDDREMTRNAIDKAIKEKENYLAEFRTFRPDGSVHWVLGRGRAFYDETGRPLRMTGIAMDIDDRKNAAQRLHLQAASLEAAANSIVIADEKGTILWTNPAFSRLTGYAAEEAAGRNFRLLSSGKHDRSFYAELWQTVLSGKIWHGEIVNRRKDGSFYTEEQTITPVRSNRGEICKFIAIKQDITQRKRAEEALQQAEQKYRSMVEEAVIGIFQSSPSGRYLTANPTMARMFGYDSPQELIESISDISKQVYVDPKRRDEFTLMMKQRGSVQNFECQVYRKDGSKMWISANARAVQKDGVVVRYEGTNEDITERKLLEDQLRQAQKMEAVGRLAGGIAHDFNNALGVITGYSELLQLRLPSEDPLHKHAEEIGKAGHRAASLTRQLLAFSRKQTIQPVVLDLNSVVTDMDKMLRRLIGEDIDLIIVRDSKLRRVNADPGQMEQIIMNLAVNARDAMPQGGKLLVKTENADLDEAQVRRYGYVRPGHYVMLSVSDTGCGMDKETQAHIFEPFFTTKEPGKGTGLGLSTVYGIVKQSEGYIWVYSEPGRGTSFKIYLREAERDAEPVGPGRLPRTLPRGTETILLVEDEESLRNFARGCLQSSGYTILDVQDGKAAIEVAKQHEGPVHLLLTDVIMPGMSGRELADNLMRSRSEMKLLYMSGYTDELITQHGVLDPGTALLEKPFGIETLLTKVREVLDGKLARAARVQ